MTRAEEILLKEMRYIASISNGQVKRVADGALASVSEYLATEPSGDRAELIQWLRERGACDGMLQPSEAADMLEADADLRTQLSRRTVERDMAISMLSDALEADVQQATPDIKDLQAKGKGPAPCARFCEANAFQIEIRRLTAEINAQQAKRVPMTPHEITEMATQEQFLLVCDGLEELTQIVRATEQRHGITPADKPTGWDNGLSQDYCAEFGQWLASRPGARQQIKEMFEAPESEDLYALALKADNWGQP